MNRNWDPRCWPEGSTTWPEDYRLGGRWPCGSTSTSDPLSFGTQGRLTDYPRSAERRQESAATPRVAEVS